MIGPCLKKTFSGPSSVRPNELTGEFNDMLRDNITATATLRHTEAHASVTIWTGNGVKWQEHAPGSHRLPRFKYGSVSGTEYIFMSDKFCFRMMIWTTSELL